MGLFLTSVSLANDYRQLWHSGFRIGIEQLGAIANDSAVLLKQYRFQKKTAIRVGKEHLRCAGKEAGHIHQCDDRDIEAVQEADKPWNKIISNTPM